MPFATPEEAEDAYYDALESGDLGALLAVWDDSDDIACALPMTALVIGRADVEGAWKEALDAFGHVDLQVRHLSWIRSADLVIHLVEELPTAAPGQTLPPIYAINAYRDSGDGWRMILHQNAPTPPPPGAPMAGSMPPDDNFPHLP